MRRRDLKSDAGVSLPELLVSLLIFGVIMAVTFSVMIQMTALTRDTLSRTDTLDQARLGIAQIDRQVRSGNVIRNPESEEKEDSGVDPFYSMRILTHADDKLQCAQWRVIDDDDDDFGDLEFRTWNPSNTLDGTDWVAVARNLVDMNAQPETADDILDDDPSTWPPFWVDESSAGQTQAQFVRITLRLKDPSERADAEPTSVSTVVTGRNTVFGYPTDSCEDAPPP